MGQQVVAWNEPMSRRVNRHYACLLRTAQLEYQLYGKILSDSVVAQLERYDRRYHAVIPVFHSIPGLYNYHDFKRPAPRLRPPPPHMQSQLPWPGWPPSASLD